MLFRVLNQPKQERVGDRIKVLLNDAQQGQFAEITLVAAFAKRAGIGRLSSALKKAKTKGVCLTGIIGIDHGGTTKEGLRDVFEACDKTYVVHSTRKDVTFHTKAYVFEGKSRAVLIVGSSNLTCGGLFTNLELCTESEFSLPAEHAEWQAAISWLNQLKDTSLQHVALLTKADLQTIETTLPLEAGITPPTKGTSTLKSSKGESLFGSGTFPAPPPMPASSKAALPSSGAGAGAVARAGAGSIKAPTVTPLPNKSGWKKLSHFDVSTKSAPGSMIVPQMLVPLFPALGAAKKQPSGALQSEIQFDARYIDGSTRKVGVRRLIHYPPAPGHARPNPETRLAFHDRSINPSGLNAGDVLVFEPISSSGSVVMNIHRIRPSDPRYNLFPGVQKKSAHGILP